MTFEVLLTARDGSQKTFKVEGNATSWRVNGSEHLIASTSPAPGVLSLIVKGKSHEVLTTKVAGESVIEVDGERFTVEIRDPRSLKSRRGAGAGQEGPKKLVAPMPGKVIRIIAQAGEEVEGGAGIIVIEAMKMQNELKSPKSGKVAKIAVKEGDTVNPGDTLAIVE
jgi:biotin carboxyl carrier protein